PVKTNSMEASPKLKPSQGFVANRMLAAQPDRVLCALASRGNAGAYDALYARYHRQIHAFIYHLLGWRANAADADDLTQDALTAAFRAIPTRRPDGSFKSWMFAIARNRTLDHLRAVKPIAGDIDGMEIPDGDSIADTVEQRAEVSWLLAAVKNLPDRQREALVLRELGGLSHEEIGRSIGTSSAGAKQLIVRARGQLTDSANVTGFRSRKLGKQLSAAVPFVPMTLFSSGTASAAGIGAVGAGTGGTIAGGVGAAAGGSKIAAAVCAAAVIGGGVAGVTHDSAPDHSGNRSGDAAAPDRLHTVTSGGPSTMGLTTVDKSGKGGKRTADDRRNSKDDDRDSDSIDRERSGSSSPDDDSSHRDDPGRSKNSSDDDPAGDDGASARDDSSDTPVEADEPETPESRSHLDDSPDHDAPAPPEVD
ncbi:MAG TPA: RNA polymerase sigma factor, partial [Solirubrobacterales bacterium]|nr:RNA polymerase sigma factor [Solirubrobacterales bacterium]